MTRRTVLHVLSLLVILCKPVLSQSQVITGPWGDWTCTSSIEASRSRVVANCTTMETNDPVTNMTNVTTSCANSTDTETATDVVSVSLGWSTWSPVIPSCGTMMSVTQSRSILCSMVDPECSTTCSIRTSTRTENIPLCCTGLQWNQWTAWSPTTCSSVTTMRTRERSRDRTSCVNIGDCEDSCAIGTESKTISPTTWNDWGGWSPMEEQMCSRGQRTRLRTCPNDPSLYCELECAYGDSETETDCCEIQNHWSTWNAWSEPSPTGCPATRTRIRTCSIDTNVGTVRNVTLTYPCSGLCTLTNTQSEQQMIFPERCAANNTGTSSDDGTVTGAAVGGAIGGVLIIVFIFTIALIVILGIKMYKKKSSYPVYKPPNEDNANPPVYDTIRLENTQYGYMDNQQDRNENVVMMPNPAYDVNTTRDGVTYRTRLVPATAEQNDENEYECMQPSIQLTPHNDDIKMDTNPSYVNI